MSSESIAPVTLGMAGVIYGDGGGHDRRDESWLTRAFRITPRTVRTEWRSDEVVMVTCQPENETTVGPGSHRSDVPSAGHLEGLVIGQFFESRGVPPRTAELSAKVLGSYARDGASSFRTVNGAWIGVVWDRQARQAHFVRDSVGSHALYAARLGDRIVFSTDMRVFQISQMLEAWDEQAIAEFMHYLYVPPPRTVAKDCYAVLAGHVLTIGTTIHQNKYSLPRFVEPPTRMRPEDVERAIEDQLPTFEDKLLTAVADSIPARGRVALALSGGQDSATLAVALSKICPDRVLAFTVGERDERLSEAHHADLVCRSLGLAHYTYVPNDDDLARGLPEFARHSDQPIGDLAAFPYFLAMSSLPDDCDVVFDGSGNDDYFGVTGTGQYLRYRVRARVQKFVPALLWPALVRLMALGPGGLPSLSRYWGRPIEESFVAWDGWSASELTRLFGREISFADTHLWQVMQNGDPDHWRSLMTEVIGGIWEAQAGFAKGVHFAQALGKSIRFPFVDERIASWVHRLPLELKLDKVIMRKYMEKNLPREIVDKPKSGFIFDLNRLFLAPEYRWAEQLDRAGLLRVIPTWSERPIRELLESHAKAPAEQKWQHRLYALSLLATVMATKVGDRTNGDDTNR